ncbi:MAG: nickel-type superoxide dismutase maturation protease [Caldilineaceae bacterium]
MNQLPQSNLREWLGWLVGRRKLVQVTGLSMTPLLQPGDRLFVNPHAYRQVPPQDGDLVVARHPHQPNLTIIKRVAFTTLDQRCYLLSDNQAEGSDSRSFGFLPFDQILGQVTSRVTGQDP